MEKLIKKHDEISLVNATTLQKLDSHARLTATTSINFARYCGYYGWHYLGDLDGRDEWRKAVRLGYEYKTTSELFTMFLSVGF